MFSFNIDPVNEMFNEHPKTKLEEICSKEEMGSIEREFFWDVATQNFCQKSNGWFEISCLCKKTYEYDYTIKYHFSEWINLFQSALQLLPVNDKMVMMLHFTIIDNKELVRLFLKNN